MLKTKERLSLPTKNRTVKGQKNDHEGKHPKLDKGLMLWLKKGVSSKLLISSHIVEEKAGIMADHLDIEKFK